MSGPHSCGTQHGEDRLGFPCPGVGDPAAHSPCMMCTGVWEVVCGPLLTALFCCPSCKALRPPTSPGVFGALQNFKEDKAKPVRDEYEYVSDDGELKIDEFPIRRKKNTPKRDLSCECGEAWVGVSVLPGSMSLGMVGAAQASSGLVSASLTVLLDKKEVLPTPVTKPKLDSAVYKVSQLPRVAEATAW